jgi:hypothetical protein
MAFELLYSFTFSGNAYDVQFDPGTDLLRVVDNTGNSVFLGAMDSATLGHTAGDVMRSECSGTTHKTVVIIYDYPFAEVQYEYNSVICGYSPPPCDLAIDSLTVTHESIAGQEDGSVVVSASGGGATAKAYSLDGINWQGSNSFQDLPPGNYTVHVRTDTTCTAIANFIIFSGLSTPSAVFPWQERVCHFFRLIYNSNTTNIREPIKWDNVNFIGKRDFDWHGYRGMYSDGVIELEFDCESGMEVLESAYNAYGNDAEVLFQYGYTFGVQDVVLFPARINFNTYKKHPSKIAASVEKDDFNQTLLSRFDAKVSMAETTGHDGASISPPLVIDTMLHAKEIVRNFSVQSSETFTAATGTFIQGTSFYIQPESSTAALNEIEESFLYPLGISTSDPVADDKYNWKNKFAGTYNYHIQYSINISFYDVQAVVLGGKAYTLKNYFQINGVRTQIGATISGTTSGSVITHTINVNQDFLNQLLAAGDKIYFYSEMAFGVTAKIIANLSQSFISTSADSLERTPDTECKGWMLFDAIDHSIKVITNNESRLKSSFLSPRSFSQASDGEGSMNIVTNGKQIRRFDVANSPLVISPKDLLTSVKNIYCLGYGVERAGSRDVVRVERVSYFYRDKKIYEFDHCLTYREEVAKEILYNELEFGYDKFLSSGFNTLDEFNTKHEYITPIKTNKAKLPVKSSLITSGYSIEDSRRQQYAATATDSYQNDDDGFLISVRRDGTGFLPEKNEPFESVANLISPQTAYNLRLSPFRMLLNWAIWLKGIFTYKLPVEKIKCTYVAQNGELTTDFLSTEAAPVGDIGKTAWQEKQDITLANLLVDEVIFRPEYVFFKAKITADIVQMIDESMKGGWSDSTNYGYLVVPDHEGNLQAGWLQTIEYNFHTEIVEIKMLKRAGGPVGQVLGGIGYMQIGSTFRVS